MYVNHFNELSTQLSGEGTARLVEIATAGGWRKRLIDSGRPGSDVTHYFPQVFNDLLSVLVRLLPPVGVSFRRSLVAQRILDQKAANW